MKTTFLLIAAFIAIITTSSFAQDLPLGNTRFDASGVHAYSWRIGSQTVRLLS